MRVVYRLLTWLSPAFPVGGYTYSHGLEYAVEAGLVGDKNGLQRWLRTVLRDGTGWSDAVLLCAAYRAAAADDEDNLRAVAEMAAALRGTAELALESSAQGAAFLNTVRAAWPELALDRWARSLAAAGVEVTYPVAVGLACAAHRVPLPLAVAAYLHAFAGNLVSAGVRLIPLGQSEGQRVVAALEPTVAAVAEAALGATLDDCGTATPAVDWASMRHETQYTRLFRS